MLYLAEVIRQNRQFMGSLKTELKLLACQHNDQTWSSIPNDESVSTEQIDQPIGEGALMMVQMGQNRQIQEPPQLAGTELVRQLQRLSRLSEKMKDEQQKIDQWKQSLTVQAQELNRREMEIDARLEQLEEMEVEFQQLERRAREIDQAEDKLHREQSKLEQLQGRYGLSADLREEHLHHLQALIQRLSNTDNQRDFPWVRLQVAQEVLQQQKTLLQGYRQQIQAQKQHIAQRQQDIDNQGQSLAQQKQAIKETESSLETAKIQLKVQENILTTKQEVLGRINLNQQLTEDLQDALGRWMTGSGDIDIENKVNLDALDKMPLGELESAVDNLKGDLEKLVRFVNDQEEELTLQNQAVQEIEAKLVHANDYDCLTLEQELEDEQEALKMLDQTLVGQRRNLKERQEILFLHLRVLRRRQGVIDVAEHEQEQRLQLEPLLAQIEEFNTDLTEERRTLETDIEHLRNSLKQVQDLIRHQEEEHRQKVQQLEQEEANWHQAQVELAQLQARCQFYDELLVPLDQGIEDLQNKLGGLVQWFG